MSPHAPPRTVAQPLHETGLLGRLWVRLFVPGFLRLTPPCRERLELPHHEGGRLCSVPNSVGPGRAGSSRKRCHDSLAIGLAACANSTSDSAATTTTASASTAAQVAITASDYAFQVPATVLSARVPGGVVQLTITSTGKESHDFQLATVGGDSTRDQIVQTLSVQAGPIPEWLHGIGGVGTVAPAPPAIAWTNVDTGKRYWFLCTESTDQNQSHAGLGMIGSFTTEGERSVSVTFPNPVRRWRRVNTPSTLIA